MLSTTMDLEKEFLEKFDSFGDSYQTKITAEKLYLLFSKMDTNVSFYNFFYCYLG